MKKIFVLLIAFLFGVGLTQAQQKRALFINGYSINCNTGWAVSNAPNLSTPAQLVVDGVLDNYQIPCLPSLNPRPQFDAALSASFYSGIPQDKWIIVGHSFGGLIARLMEAPYPQLRPILTNLGVQLKGIITMGTPHQGAPAAANFANASYMMQTFKNDVLAGPAYGTSGIYQWLLIMNNGGRPYYEDLANKLNDATAAVENVSQSVLGQVLPYVAPGSSFINSLQSIPTQVPHLAIAGVESSPALIRWVPTIDYGSGADEKSKVDEFNSIKNGYNDIANYHLYLRDYNYYLWRMTPCWLFPGTCDDLWQEYVYNRDARSAWGRGWWALNGIDDQWFQIHNEYLQAEAYYDFWISCSEAGDNFYRVDQLESLFKAYDPCDYGIPGYYERMYYTYYYAERSDGLVPLNRAKWGTYENFSDANAAPSSLNQANVYFDGAGEADGGYNNGEMRDLKRRYGARGDSWPMKKAIQWMQSKLAQQ